MSYNFNKKNKYWNNKFTVDGIKWDSQKEYNRFQELLMLQKSGVISELQRQVKFEVIPSTATERAAYYIADFVYKSADGKMIIEDVKSVYTRKLHDYILKRKLIKWRYPDYNFVEYS